MTDYQPADLADAERRREHNDGVTPLPEDAGIPIQTLPEWTVEFSVVQDGQTYGGSTVARGGNPYEAEKRVGERFPGVTVTKVTLGRR